MYETEDIKDISLEQEKRTPDSIDRVGVANIQKLVAIAVHLPLTGTEIHRNINSIICYDYRHKKVKGQRLWTGCPHIYSNRNDEHGLEYIEPYVRDYYFKYLDIVDYTDTVLLSFTWCGEAYGTFTFEYAIELFSRSIQKPFPHLERIYRLNVWRFDEYSVDIGKLQSLTTYFQSIMLSHMSITWNEIESDVVTKIFSALQQKFASTFLSFPSHTPPPRFGFSESTCQWRSSNYIIVKFID